MTSTPLAGPSPWYYLLGVPPLLAGAALFGYTLFHGIFHITDSLTQVVIPGETELTLVHSQPYTVFFEQQSIVNGKIYVTNGSLNGLQCKVIALSNEQAVPVRRPSMNTTYSVGDRSGRSILEFQVPADGQYKFACAYTESTQAPEAVLAVGAGVGEKIFRMVLRSLAALFGGLGFAGIIFLSVLVLRGRAKSQSVSSLPARL